MFLTGSTAPQGPTRRRYVQPVAAHACRSVGATVEFVVESDHGDVPHAEGVVGADDAFVVEVDVKAFGDGHAAGPAGAAVLADVQVGAVVAEPGERRDQDERPVGAVVGTEEHMASPSSESSAKTPGEYFSASAGLV